MQASSQGNQAVYKVMGGHESYFTGKIEAYLRAKGIPYENVPFTIKELQIAAQKTNFFQIPLINCPDGTWLVDTTLMIEYLDTQYPDVCTAPTDAAANFISLLLEDYADEWLWRPAMHYRWSFPNSVELLSSWLAEHSPDDDTSLAEKKAGWHARQHGTFVAGDGVTEENRAAVESNYHEALTSLEEIFKTRDFILGDRPTQADFGFFGPMFRHFFCDPDPARIMRDNAPGVHEWVARMWNMSPQRFTTAAQVESIASDLAPLLKPVSDTYLTYLIENEKAVVAEQKTFSYDAQGAGFIEPAKPYRLWCLDQLREQYQALDETAQDQVGEVLGDNAAAILATQPSGCCDQLLATMPITPTSADRQWLDSWGRPAGEGAAD